MELSVILPSYNGGKFIGNAIKSVLDQSFSQYELLVIDDGSTDNTAEIVQEISKRDGRLRYVRQETNLGLQQTLNNGLRLAKGHYIARLDDDDVWIDKDKLKIQVEFLDRHPTHVLVGTGHIFVDETGKELHRFMPPSTDPEIRKIILRDNVFLHSAVMYRRDIVLQVGGYNYERLHGDDYDLWLKLGTIGKLANLPTYAVAYNTRKGSISSKHLVVQLKNSIHIIGRYKNDYQYYYHSILKKYLELFVYGIMGISLYSPYKLQIIKFIRNVTTNIDKKSFFDKVN